MDRDILRQFYRRYSGEIYLYLYSLCKSRETAEDLMQEVFLKALLSLSDQNENLHGCTRWRETPALMNCGTGKGK